MPTESADKKSVPLSPWKPYFDRAGDKEKGAMIESSTQKLHARGPLALRELTSYKYIVRSDGRIKS